MASSGITYSRFVAFLKVVLPLTALVLLSTLFLVSNRISDSTASIPFAKVDLEQRAREQQITAPFFSGRTSAGHLVAFTAQSARPDSEKSAHSKATQMAARIDLTDGSQITVTADTAYVDNSAHRATLIGKVALQSTNGYDIRTETLVSEMRELRMEAPGQVTGNGPGGDLKAGQMTITTDEKTGVTTLFFTKGVKLIYTPMH